MKTRVTCHACGEGFLDARRRSTSVLRCPHCGSPNSTATQLKRTTRPTVIPEFSEPSPTRFTRKRQSPWVLALKYAVILVVLASVLFVALQWNGDVQQAVKDVAPNAIAQAVIPDSDLKLVRAYLEENTPTGEWEEIRWWSAESTRKQALTLIQDAKQQLAQVEHDVKTAKQTIRDFADQGIEIRGQFDPYSRRPANMPVPLFNAHSTLYDAPTSITNLNNAITGTNAEVAHKLTLVRLKYRTKNPVGALSVFDKGFLIKDQRAIPLSEYDEERYWKYVPDDGGQKL